jgi:hypothetical protein
MTVDGNVEIDLPLDFQTKVSLPRDRRFRAEAV